MGVFDKNIILECVYISILWKWGRGIFCFCKVFKLNFVGIFLGMFGVKG